MKKLLIIVGVFIINFLLVLDVQGKVLTREDFDNLYGLERAYIVGNYVFNMGSGFNPSLKDLLIASSYNELNETSVYEIKVSPNIDGEIIREYHELLKNEVLNGFPNTDVKYIYDTSIDRVDARFHDIDTLKILEYKTSTAKILTKEDYNNLNINRSYIVGEYLFNLDNGFNPSLEDLLKASTTYYTNDVKIYEIKKSENIDGDIVEEYNELLSNTKLNEFPIIKVKYVYSKHISNNNPDQILSINDTISFNDITKTYTGNLITASGAVSENNLDIVYEYYSNNTCGGTKLENGVINVGEYGVLAKSISSGNIIGDSVCRKLTVVPKDDNNFTINVIDLNNIYTGEEIKPGFEVLKDDAPLELNKDYTFSYSNNVNVGEGIINVTFKGNYQGSASARFNIIKKEIRFYSSNYEKVYDGKYYEEDKISFCKISRGYSLALGDSVVSCRVKSVGRDVGDHTLEIKSIRINKGEDDVTSNYSIIVDSGINTITPRSTSCTLNPKNKVYNGTKLDLILQCSNLVKGQNEVPTKTLPTLINVQDSTIFSLEKTEVKILDHDVDVSSNYTINISHGGLIPLAILAKNADRNPKVIVTLEYDRVVGDETPKEPRIVSVYDEELGVYLQENESYNYTYFNNVNPGTGEVRIEFKGNYEGNRTETFIIE